MHNQIFSDVLQHIGDRITIKSNPSKIFLDKNEQPFDIDDSIKQTVLDELHKTNWNRYPPANNTELETLIASYTGLYPENIAVAPGSAYIITTLLNYFAINRNHIVIAQPSYTLFDYHCKTFGIDYEPWYLNNLLEFDLDHLPKLTDKSVLILASPNNPVGNIISYSQLEKILQNNSQSLIILDAVYLEFCNINLNPLIQSYPNLIVLKSFSKAFPAAGCRLGYLCASNTIVSMVKKLILMFSINHFSQVLAKAVLSNSSYLMKIENLILEINAERNRLYQNLQELEQEEVIITKKPEGNFILLKIPDSNKFNLVLNQLSSNGIQILNTSNLKMLENTIRVSVGSTEENTAFFNCLKSALK